MNNLVLYNMENYEQKYPEVNWNSPARDIANIHNRIIMLKRHFVSNKKDFPVSRRIMQLEARKKRMFKYLNRYSKNTYDTLFVMLKNKNLVL